MDRISSPIVPAIRKLAAPATDNGLQAPEPAASIRLREASLLRAFGFSMAGTLTLRTLSGARAIGALAAIAGPLAHRALAQSTTHVALHSLFTHDAMYSTLESARTGPDPGDPAR